MFKCPTIFWALFVKTPFYLWYFMSIAFSIVLLSTCWYLCFFFLMLVCKDTFVFGKLRMNSSSYGPYNNTNTILLWMNSSLYWLVHFIDFDNKSVLLCGLSTVVYFMDINNKLVHFGDLMINSPILWTWQFFILLGRSRLLYGFNKVVNFMDINNKLVHFPPPGMKSSTLWI